MAYGIPNPYAATTHPYPTRYHGGIWTRPEFGFPAVVSPQAVFKPTDFNAANPALRGLGEMLVTTGNGVFGEPSGGGGVFGPSLYGLGYEPPTFYPTADVATTSTATQAPALKGQGAGGSGDSRVAELQGYLNRVLAAAGFAPLTQDGRLGPKACGAIAWYRATGRALASSTTAAAIDQNLGALGAQYAQACSALTPVAPAKSAASAPPSLLPPPPPPVAPTGGGLDGLTMALIGGGVLAVGVAYVGTKKGWFR